MYTRAVKKMFALSCIFITRVDSFIRREDVTL